jgi:hypothetical protein
VTGGSGLTSAFVTVLRISGRAAQIRRHPETSGQRNTAAR